MSTKEEILAAWGQAKERIKPAILADVISNGNLVNGYMVNHKLSYTVDGFYTAVKALMRDLQWDRKPAALLLQEQTDKPVKAESNIASEKAFADRKATIEAREKLAADNAATEKLIEGAIAGYYPTSRMGRLSRPKQEAEQTRLRKWVAAQIARNANRGQILVIVNSDIERLYREEATHNERL